VVFFQPEGVDAQAGGRADDAALQAALTATVVAVPGLAGAGNLPFDQLVERIGGEGSRLVVVRVAREVAREREAAAPRSSTRPIASVYRLACISVRSCKTLSVYISCVSPEEKSMTGCVLWRSSNQLCSFVVMIGSD